MDISRCYLPLVIIGIHTMADTTNQTTDTIVIWCVALIAQYTSALATDTPMMMMMMMIMIMMVTVMYHYHNIELRLHMRRKTSHSQMRKGGYRVPKIPTILESRDYGTCPEFGACRMG